MHRCLLTPGQYVKCLYGVVDPDIVHATEQDVEDDIESSIWKEINSIAGKHGPAQLFTPVYLDLQCVLFFKTRPPIIPVDFVRRICEDASNNAAKKKIRFVNRLTPMTMIAKATEKGLEEVGKLVLGEHFQLVGEEKYVDPETEKKQSRVSTSHFFRCSLIIFQRMLPSWLSWSQEAYE
jgi:tRNA acetyltransferase TAN1